MTTSATAKHGMELGLYTFGDLVKSPHANAPPRGTERMDGIVAAARMADEAGLDVFAVGEHHRLDTLVSSPPVVLAAIAQVTERVRLTSATTVLPTADPIRVFEDFATVDVLSHGRAEMIVGRGAFTESFPLFGYDLEKRDALFAEHLDVLMRANASERVTWEGRLRPKLVDAQVAPRPAQKKLPIWIGVGVTPESAARAGTLGLPMSLAILGTQTRMKHLVDAYRRAGDGAGHAADDLAVGVASHMHIAKTSKEARDRFYPHYVAYFQAMGRPGMPRSDFDAICTAQDGLLVGSPQDVVEKILVGRELFAHDRYIGQIDIGGVPYGTVREVIELFAGEVAPAVRRATKTG